MLRFAARVGSGSTCSRARQPSLRDVAIAEKWRWPDGPQCPHCDSGNVSAVTSRRLCPTRSRWSIWRRGRRPERRSSLPCALKTTSPNRRRAVATVIGGLLLAGCTTGPAVAPPVSVPAPTSWAVCEDGPANLDYGDLAMLEIEWFAESLQVDDLAAAQIHYDNGMSLTETVVVSVDAYLANCASHARAAGTYTEYQETSAEAKEAIAQMRNGCLDVLAPHGFDC